MSIDNLNLIANQEDHPNKTLQDSKEAQDSTEVQDSKTVQDLKIVLVSMLVTASKPVIDSRQVTVSKLVTDYNNLNEAVFLVTETALSTLKLFLPKISMLLVIQMFSLLTIIYQDMNQHSDHESDNNTSILYFLIFYLLLF